MNHYEDNDSSDTITSSPPGAAGFRSSRLNWNKDHDYEESSRKGNETSLDADWTDERTDFILNRYDEYITEFGPMKTLKQKKYRWKAIASELNQAFGIKKSASQVENRFQTILRRKLQSHAYVFRPPRWKGKAQRHKDRQDLVKAILK